MKLSTRLDARLAAAAVCAAFILLLSAPSTPSASMQSTVTRQQMAAFIIRAPGDFSPPPPAMQRFADVPPSNFFYPFIEQMALRQITLGCAANLYCPDDPVTRQQMAAFLVRAFQLN